MKHGLFAVVGEWPGSLSASASSRYLAAVDAAAHPGSASAGEPPRCFAPQVAVDGGITVLLRGAPRWAAGRLAGTGEFAEQILASYRADGEKLLDDLRGAFAIAIIDLRAHSCLLAIDSMGIEQLSFATAPKLLVIGSAPGWVATCPGISRGLRAQALFDYLLLHMVPSPSSVHQGVQKLEPGTCALYRDGVVKVRRYWRPVFVEQRHADSTQLGIELRAVLQRAVRATAPGPRTGAFLSGGLDSSTVAGSFARSETRPVPTFSIGFGVAGYDELSYARISSRHFGTRQHEYLVGPADIVDAFPKIAAAYDEPFGNSSAVPTYFCARLAANHGVDHLLAGDGGDELFGGNERYARQQVFDSYGRLPAWLRATIVEPIAACFDAETSPLPFRKLRSYVDQARIPMPERLESWNLMYRTDLGKMLTDEFRAAIDTRAPLVAMAKVFNAAECRSLLNKMLFYDWHYTLADNDLRKVATMCELAGVRVSYPMLDPEVVDLSLRVPPSLKMRRLQLRSFFKDAMRGFLPAEVLSKQKHGFGLPFGVWLKTHAQLAEMIYAYLLALRERRIVRASFIDQLIDEHRSGHPGYFGYAIWDLAMLEAWMQAHPAALAA